MPIIEQNLLALEEFENSPLWRRSQRGNLSRPWEFGTVTIFKRRDGRYGWCRNGDEGPQFSNESWEFESEAFCDLARELGIILWR